jgi:hypothetical protein
MEELKKVLKKYAEYVIEQAKENLKKGGRYGTHDKSGELSKSLSYIIDINNKISFQSLKYGEFLDKGVKGAKSTYPESRESPFKYTDKMPPSSVFDKWSIRSGIAPRDEKGRFIKRKSLSFAIAKSIYKKGIRASMFFTKPFEDALPLFEDDMLDALLNDNLKLD